MKNNVTLLAVALLAMIGWKSAQSQTPPDGKSVPTVQPAPKADPENVYVIRHHGGLNIHRPLSSTVILSPSVPNVGPAEAAASDALCQDGAAQVKKGNLNIAHDEYNQALNLWPNSKNALYGAAECAIAAADFPRAASYYRIAVYSTDPSQYGTTPGDGFQENNVSRLMQFAFVLSRAGQASEGIFVYNRAAYLLDYQDSQSNGGKPHLKVLLPELAAEPASPKPIQYTPERLQALADTALAYAEMGFGSNLEAITHMREAATLYPDSAPVQYYLGEALSGSYYAVLDSSLKDKAAAQSVYEEDKKGEAAAYKRAVELGDEATAAEAKEKLKVLR